MRPPRSAFWAYHAAYWAAYLAIVFVSLLPVSTLAPLPLLLSKAVWAASGFVVSLPLRGAYDRVLRSARPWRLVAAAILGSLITAAAWLAAYALIELPAIPAAEALVRTYAALSIAIGAWSGGYMAVALWRVAAAERLARVDAERLAHESQLHALRHPLNPHFLFNALATIRALVRENPPQARDAITQLAELLRESLQHTSGDFVRIAQEVEATRRYLALEAMRFEDRLHARVAIEPGLADRLIPAFALRSLVENAVKHGRAGGDGRLVVDASVTTDAAGAIAVRVTNSGALAPSAADGAAIGLRNLRERLVRLYPDRHAFALTESDGTVTALLTIGPERGQ